MSAAFDHLFDVGDYSLNMVFVKPVLSHQDIYLIKSRFFSQLDQRCEIYVPINDILHAGLSLAHIVYAAANHEWLLNAICSFYCNGITNICFRNLKGVALDQDLTF